MKFRVGRTYVLPARPATARSTLIPKLLALVVLVGVPAFVGWAEYARREMTLAFREAHQDFVSVSEDRSIQAEHVGRLIHLTSSNVWPDIELRDENFRVSFASSLRARRVTEYCQWMETFVDRTVEGADGEKVTTRTYYYDLSWRSYLIPSLLFDQPGAHHNPLRDPFPSTYFDVPMAHLGAFKLGPSLITKLNHYRHIRFDFDSLRIGFAESHATHDHGFAGGNDGWFYSPYQPGTLETLVRNAAMLAEGSLFDFQLGDLLPSCTPGDIRVHFETVTPTSLSVLALLAPEGELVPWRTSRNYDVALVQEGRHTPDVMFDTALASHFRIVVLSRVLLFVWSWAAVSISGILAGGVWFHTAGAALCFTSTLVGLLLVALWGVTLRATLLLLPGLIVAYLLRSVVHEPPGDETQEKEGEREDTTKQEKTD